MLPIIITKHVFNVPVLSSVSFPQLMRSRPNASWRHRLVTARSVPTSPSVTSRAATCPYSAGAPLATAGVWIQMAKLSRAPKCVAVLTVREVETQIKGFLIKLCKGSANNKINLIALFSFILGSGFRRMMVAPRLMQKTLSIDGKCLKF